MKTLENLEKKLEKIQEQIDILKEHKDGEKLNYLNEQEDSHTRNPWLLALDDTNDIEYITIDKSNRKINYCISAYEPYSNWHFDVRVLDKRNKWVSISLIESSKNSVTFEKFIKEIVNPIISATTYEEE